MESNLENRRTFASTIAKSIAGITLISFIPKVILTAGKKRFWGIKVAIHPNAVKRNK